MLPYWAPLDVESAILSPEQKFLLSINQRLTMMVPIKQPIIEPTGKVAVHKQTDQFYWNYVLSIFLDSSLSICPVFDWLMPCRSLYMHCTCTFLHINYRRMTDTRMTDTRITYTRITYTHITYTRITDTRITCRLLPNIFVGMKSCLVFFLCKYWSKNQQFTVLRHIKIPSGAFSNFTWDLISVSIEIVFAWMEHALGP